MFLTGIGTATPIQRYTKADCWEAFRESDWFGRLGPRAHAIAQTVLLRDNGIEARRLAVGSLSEVFQIDPDTLHQRFVQHAPVLAGEAGKKALQQAQLLPVQIDAVVVSTCTGYLCPGLSTYLIEQLGLRPDVQAFDLVGQGCAAAVPNLQLATSLLATGQCAHVLSVCVEVCSAAMYLDDDPGVLISACLFGDGAGAAVLSRQPAASLRRIRVGSSRSLTLPAARNALRFEQRQGMLRNILTREVPQLAARHATDLMQQTLASAGISRQQISTWILHAGGRDVLQALQHQMEIAPEALRYSAAVLREFGNLSSPTVFFVLQAALEDGAEGGWWWMSAFGAGFSCHGVLLAVD